MYTNPDDNVSTKLKPLLPVNMVTNEQVNRLKYNVDSKNI